MDLLLFYQVSAPKFLGILAGGTFIALLCVGMLVFFILFYNSRRQALQLREVLTRMKADEDARKQLAGELHSSLGQRLTAAKSAAADTVLEVRALGGATATAEFLEELIRDCLSETRAMTQANYGVTLLQQGLLPAVQGAIELLDMQLSIDVRVEIPSVEPPLSDEHRLWIFRIVQDLLANVRQHSMATKVRLRIVTTPHKMLILVADNGVGFEVGQHHPQTGIGLHTLQQRVDQMRGAVTIESAPGSGTAVNLEIPLHCL